MKTTLAFQSAIRFANRLKKLHELRVKEKVVNQPRRQSFSDDERDLILRKTGKRCHICGGKIKNGENWQVDHIFLTHMEASILLKIISPPIPFATTIAGTIDPKNFSGYLSLVYGHDL